MPILALFDSGCKVHVIYLTFAKELDLSIRPIDVEAQKINGTMLDTFGMVISAFSVMNKANQVKFFEKTFLVANVSLEIVLEILFLILSGANVNFYGRKLWWRTYTTKKALLTTRHIKLVGKKEFVAVALDPEFETYVLHIRSVCSVALSSSSPLNVDVHPSRRPQIYGLIGKKALAKVSAKYSNFADVFSLDLVSKLLEHTRINNHAIKLVDGQQPPYKPIYNLEAIELETLKAYIETNLANSFIKRSKSPAAASILFDKKSNSSLRLCVNYQDRNNFTIKNQYSLLLIGELLDRLERAKQFI